MKNTDDQYLRYVTEGIEQKLPFILVSLLFQSLESWYQHLYSVEDVSKVVIYAMRNIWNIRKQHTQHQTPITDMCVVCTKK